MSDQIKHECGIAMVRLRKPLNYYVEKYGTPLYGIQRLYLLMQKQHNRGQDGAGVAIVKCDATPGTNYMTRERSIKSNAIEAIFSEFNEQYQQLLRQNPDKAQDTEWLKQELDFMGDVMMGHLRYGTHGGNCIDNCHPMLRQNNWRSRSLAVAGNFNMTNNEELYQKLLELGQHPHQKIDTITVLEKIGHFLDEENQALFDHYKDRYTNQQITGIIERELDLQRVLKRACKDFDGGYAMAGIVGNGSAFVVRDPAGIRPAFYYMDDEVVVVASEKPAIKTAFDPAYDAIKEITPGCALIINKDGDAAEKQIREPLERKSCSFERIYFSRGNSPEIYNERKNMGRYLCPQILEAINYDLPNTVFSFIPNTAETSFYGMLKGMDAWLIEHRISSLKDQKLTKEQFEEILTFRPRVEKLVIKDAKLRTFITDNAHRDDLVTHVYDTTYEVIRKGIDTVVVLDDSIVRGTTLEKSIIRMLDKLGPKKIIIVSCAPQIRYPDCYGIDMSKMKEFVVFRAVLALLEEYGMESKLDQVYERCLAAQDTPEFSQRNFVQELYAPFSYTQISGKVAELVRASDVKAEVEVIFQTVDDLHRACPQHTGDWYFTGNYPTPGGFRVVNRSFMNFVEKKEVRAY